MDFYSLALSGFGFSNGSDGALASIMGAFGTMYAVMMLFYCLLFLAGLASVVIWVWMLVDCVRRENYEKENDKIVWILVVALTGVLGAIIYYFLIKRKLDVPAKKIPVSKTKSEG